MKRINELYVEKANRLIALGLLGRITLTAFEQAIKSPDSEFHTLFKEMSARLPEHYLSNREIQVAEYKAVSFVDSQNLITMVSEAETFFQETMIEVVKLYPAKISKTNIDLRKLIELGDIQSAILFAASKHANEVMYKRPSEYKKDFLNLISADEHLLDDLWPQYVEAKARRDIGVHNSWKVNDIYRSRISEVGLPDPIEEELSVDYPYFQRVREVTIALMGRVNLHCEQKFV